MKLVKVSDKPNLPMIWTVDRMDEIVKLVPEARLIHRKNGAGYDKDEILPIPVIYYGRAMRFLSPFEEFPTFIRTTSGCMKSYLYWKKGGYTLVEWWCQMNYGDRNLRPIDEDTGEIPHFAGVIKGFFESSNKSSQSHKTALRHIWNEENYNKSKIISACNMKMNRYVTGSFYFAKLNDTDKIKLGFSKYEDVTQRMREHRAENYVSIIKCASGTGNAMLTLEKIVKLKFNLPDELFDIELTDQILDYIYNTKFEFPLELESRQNVHDFICK